MKGRGWAESVRGEEEERWYNKKEKKKRRWHQNYYCSGIHYANIWFSQLHMQTRTVSTSIHLLLYIVNNPYFIFVIVCCMRVCTHRSAPGTQLILIVNIRSLPTRTLTNNTIN